MNNLVFKGQNNQVLTNSLLVAEKFGKKHYHVMDSIRNLLNSHEKSGQYFVLGTYIDNSGKENPMYVMNRDGFTLLVMGFTGEKALQFKMDYIEAFNKMEQTIHFGGFSVPSTFREALILAAKQQEQIEEQQKKIKQDAPKVLFADAVSTSQRSCLVSELAKIIQQNGVNIGQNRLFQWLRDNGYLCAKGQYYNQPTQRSMGMGLFEIKQTTINKPDGSILVTTTTKVSGKGQVYFVNKFLQKQTA
ncbi:Rha family transcriptional regulator [Coprobacter sp.]|uniref:Rha family transcriptional regulator n=1 Tax=Coprobacter sp. TaxID=1941478 RepID=UPI003AB116DC